MRKFAIDLDPGYCHCGAPCDSRKIRCRKCHARFRWYRRKARRRNPMSYGRSRKLLREK